MRLSPDELRAAAARAAVYPKDNGQFWLAHDEYEYYNLESPDYVAKLFDRQPELAVFG